VALFGTLWVLHLHVQYACTRQVSFHNEDYDMKPYL